MDLFGFFGRRKKQKVGVDPFMQHQMMSRIDSVDADQIPGGYGPFGLCATNPVPTHSVAGSSAYLENLRTGDGRPIRGRRTGSTSAKDVTNGMIDIYQITTDDQMVATIYLCPYHRRNSAKAPDGFRTATTESAPQDEKYVEAFFSDPDDFVRFFDNVKYTLARSKDGVCEARLEKIDPERWLYMVSRNGQYLADYVRPFKPSNENIEMFNHGTREMAQRLRLYMQGADISQLPPPFGPLTTFGPPPDGAARRF